jgi:hypothetical protein
MNNHFEELESTFNWEYVHWVMEQINWTWDMNGEQRVPTISEMKQCVRDLLQEFTPDSTEISSGGFVLKRGGGDDAIELHFMVA